MAVKQKISKKEVNVMKYLFKLFFMIIATISAIFILSSCGSASTNKVWTPDGVVEVNHSDPLRLKLESHFGEPWSDAKWNSYKEELNKLCLETDDEIKASGKKFYDNLSPEDKASQSVYPRAGVEYSLGARVVCPLRANSITDYWFNLDNLE